MKTLLRCTLATLALAGTAQAQSDALIVGNGSYSVLDRLTGASGVLAATSPLEREGFAVVQLGEATATQMRAGLGRFIAGLDGQTERVAVILSGRFVHSASDSYLLPVGMEEPLTPGAVFAEALPLSVVLGLLADYPGAALLVLGEGDSDALDLPFLRAGAGVLDAPQGVSVIRGAPEAVSRLAQRDLAVPDRPLLARARAAGLEVSGYAPEGWHLLPTAVEQDTDSTITSPAPVQPSRADEQLWQSVSARDTLEGYRTYLDTFPEGDRANAARQRIRAIEAEPERDQRLAEEALTLSRDARREIQRNLSLLDYDTRGIDGIFGPGTRGAITAWQDRNGFAASGYLDREQITRIAAQAERRAAELEEDARQRQAELERLDRAYWEETGARGDLPGLRAYLDRYPDGVFAEVANERLEAIEAERREQAAGRDRDAWDQAQDAGSLSAYRRYLEDFPNGAFAEQARGRIEDLQRSDGDRERMARAEAQEAALNLNAGARRIAEDRLRALGLKPGEVDGVFDGKTRRAIRRYQEARSLSVTGYLDQATVVRLLADSLLR